MKKEYLIKSLITICLITFAIYFGVNIARSAIFYEIYNINTATGKLQLNSNINIDLTNRSIYHYFQLSAYTSISYIIFLVSLLVLLLLHRGNIKKYGWLFMVAVLIIIFSPFELYIIYNDIIISTMIFANNNFNYGSNEIVEYMKLRTNTTISLINGLSFLSQITVFILAVFKPLNIESKQ